MAAVINVLLNVVLVPRFELVGSAAATFLAYACLYGLLLFQARTATLDVPAVGQKGGRKLLQAGLALTVTVALLSSVLPSDGGFLALRTALAVACLGWFAKILLKLSRTPPLPRSS